MPEIEPVLLLQMQAMDDAADEQFSNDVASAIVDWVAQRMSDYHKNFHDTSLMQARALAMDEQRICHACICWLVTNASST